MLEVTCLHAVAINATMSNPQLPPFLQIKMVKIEYIIDDLLDCLDDTPQAFSTLGNAHTSEKFLHQTKIVLFDEGKQMAMSLKTFMRSFIIPLLDERYVRR